MANVTVNGTVSSAIAKNCTYPANPDIAGIGIVLGLLIADALSLVLIAILFGLRLHLNLMDQTGQAERRTKKRILIVAKVLSGLFTGQVIAGLGEAIAAYVTLNFDDPNPDDPHPALAADLTMLSGLIGVASISLLWTLLLDRNSPGVTVRLFISGSLGLMGWTLQIPTLKSATQALARFWVCTAYLGLSLIVLLVHSPKKGKMPSNVTRTVLAIHFIFAFAALIYFLIDAMVIRFGHSGLCSLKVKEEDVWTFGQIVALVLLLSPVLATVDAISESRFEAEESASTQEGNGQTGTATGSQQDTKTTRSPTNTATPSAV